MEYLKEGLTELTVQEKIELASWLLTEVSGSLFAISSSCNNSEDDGEEILESDDE